MGLGLSWLWKEPKAPQAPDPNALIQQQAEVNRYNQKTPWGNTLWDQDSDGNWTQTVTQSQDAARAQRELGQFNQQIPTNLTGPSLRTGAPWALAQPQQLNAPWMVQHQGVNTPQMPNAAAPSQLPGVQAVTPWTLPQLGNQDYGQQRDQVIDSVFNSGAQRINQQADMDRRKLEQRMANQGLPMGGEASNQQTQLQEQGINDARNRLALESVLAGGQEQSRLAGLDLARYGAGLQGAQTGFGQNLAANQNLFGQGMDVANTSYGQQANSVNQQSDLLQRMFGNQQSEAARGFNENLQGSATNFDQQRNAQNDYINQVLAGSGQAFSQDLAANQQNFGQSLASQQQLLQALTARMGNYQAAPAAQVDVFGPAQLQQAALQNAYQGQVQRQQGILGGVANLGAAALMGPAGSLGASLFRRG